MSHKLQNADLKPIFTEYFNKVTSLYWKTHSAHWNLVSTDFYSLHKLLDEQYNALWDSLDAIAEHMRALELAAPHQLQAETALPLGSERNAFLEELIEAQGALVQWLRTAIREVDALGDISGADFLTERLAEHEKMAWMLKASLSA